MKTAPEIPASKETIYMTAAQTAVYLRQDLKHCFPEIKFSVRSKNYSGGCNVSVHWKRGPNNRRVEAVMDRYTSATFDGMTDSKETITREYLEADGSLTRVHWGNDYGGHAVREWEYEYQEYTDYLDCARIIAARCHLEGPSAHPTHEEIGTPGLEKPWMWFQTLHRWRFGSHDLQTLARAMAFERDWILDADWERSFKAAVLSDWEAKKLPVGVRQGGAS